VHPFNSSEPHWFLRTAAARPKAQGLTANEPFAVTDRKRDGELSRHGARPSHNYRAPCAPAAERASLTVDDRAIRDEVRVEHDARMLAAQQRLQGALAGFDRLAPQVFAVEL
jgi:hypothetical protein